MNFQNIDTKVLIAGTAAIAATLGYTLGYRRAAKKWIAIADEEINRLQEQHRRLRMEGMETPAQALQTLHPEVVDPERYRTKSEDPEEPVKTGNVFSNYLPSEDRRSEERQTIEVETLPEPDPDRPYVISGDTFMEVDDSIEKTTLTYFDEDETLVDERNAVIYDVDILVGVENLTKFGLGTEEEHVVHVRNEALGRDFEIVREDAAYATVVLGLDNDEPKPKKSKNKKLSEDE